ncbi:MAG: gliding motility-associated C-terminal domain-containing protein [Bacteroidota bacterium]
MLYRILFVTLCTSFLSIGLLSGQGENLCSGSLGENIFEDGDFGSGAANVLQQDPGIAPGYIYSRNPPPNDGFYTITNSMARWSDNFGSWIGVSDNSSDPNGYMMVVNASFTPGIFYEKTISGLCENTVYEFSADIINVISRPTTGHILPNVSFALDGVTQFTTGGIPQSETWITYGFTFTTPPGVTEMTLTLRNNAPGGIGNDLALDNISFRACGASTFINTDQNIFLCENDNTPQALTADIDIDNFFIQWQLSRDGGQNWSTLDGENGEQFFHSDFNVGTYRYRYLSSSTFANLQNFKCRVISEIITIEVLPLEYEFQDTICAGLPYTFGSQTLTQTGTYIETFLSSRGCDSVVTLELFVPPNQLAFDILSVIPACPSSQDGRLEIVNISQANPPLTFFLDGEIIASNIYRGLGVGNYTMGVRDRFGCSLTKEAELRIDEFFIIDVGPPIALDFGEESEPILVNSNFPIGNISWEPTEFLSCSDCTSPQITGVKTTSYVITATDELGCETRDTLFIRVDDTNPKIFIPNAFSPNGDDINDTFEIFTTGKAVSNILSFRIFDRWGNLILQRLNSSDLRWNGRLNGELLGQGVYLFQLELELIDGRILREAGSINLLK